MNDKYLIYSHDDFQRGIDRIVEQVRQSDFQPDYIVGVVRGGAVPSVYLSHRLGIPVQMVHWNTRDHEGQESNLWIPEDLVAGKKVLIVEDIIDSGLTISQLLVDWQSSVRADLPLDNIRICCMIYNTAQERVPDYYDQTIDRDVDQRWVVFPWESNGE